MIRGLHQRLEWGGEGTTQQVTWVQSARPVCEVAGVTVRVHCQQPGAHTGMAACQALHTRRYLRRQHLLLGLYLLLLARCHFLELSEGQIHPRTINLREKTTSHAHGWAQRLRTESSCAMDKPHLNQSGTIIQPFSFHDIKETIDFFTSTPPNKWETEPGIHEWKSSTLSRWQFFPH